MNKKIFFAWTGLIVLSMIPAFLWFAFGDTGEFSVSVTHSLGELFGLIGMTMFALTFVLSARIRFIEDLFGGLDKVYIVHGILGGTAIILILLHPVFLVLKFVPSNISLAAQYLLPSSYWSVNFGIIALLGLAFLVSITLFTKIKYHKWKFTHEFLGLFFIFAVLHIFLVRGTVSTGDIFTGYYIYAFLVSLIGIGAFFYSLFLKNRFIKNAVYVIEKIKQHRNHTFEVTLVPEYKPLSYRAGQFVFLRFYNKTLSKEQHPFSIASKSNDYKLKVIIKKLGDYTENIHTLSVGDKVSVEGPYGRFNFKDFDKDQIWIAAGIGITPFIGMTEDLKNSARNTELYYIVKSEEDFIDYDNLRNTSSKVKKFKFIPWSSEIKGRITAKDMNLENLKNKEIFICGPDEFKESIIKDLILSGARKESIHEEVFDFR